MAETEGRVWGDERERMTPQQIQPTVLSSPWPLKYRRILQTHDPPSGLIFGERINAAGSWAWTHLKVSTDRRRPKKTEESWLSWTPLTSTPSNINGGWESQAFCAMWNTVRSCRANMSHQVFTQTCGCPCHLELMPSLKEQFVRCGWNLSLKHDKQSVEKPQCLCHVFVLCRRDVYWS